MKHIRIFLSGGAWHADFENDSHVLAYFGTTVIPTPFTVSTPASTVLKTVSERNPDCVVRVDQGYGLE